MKYCTRHCESSTEEDRVPKLQGPHAKRRDRKRRQRTVLEAGAWLGQGRSVRRWLQRRGQRQEMPAGREVQEAIIDRIFRWKDGLVMLSLVRQFSKWGPGNLLEIHILRLHPRPTEPKTV